MWSGTGVHERGVDVPTATAAYDGSGCPGGLHGGGIWLRRAQEQRGQRWSEGVWRRVARAKHELVEVGQGQERGQTKMRSAVGRNGIVRSGVKAWGAGEGGAVVGKSDAEEAKGVDAGA